MDEEKVGGSTPQRIAPAIETPASLLHWKMLRRSTPQRIAPAIETGNRPLVPILLKAAPPKESPLRLKQYRQIRRHVRKAKQHPPKNRPCD